jgi:hypothetical protein
MTNEDYPKPIAPTPDLVQQWLKEFYGAKLQYVAEASIHLAARAAQWGADQELEACCEYVYERLKVTTIAHIAQDLRTARRPEPKPPSLKEQAYAALDTYIYGNPDHGDKQNTYNTIRRALEQLPDNK